MNTLATLAFFANHPGWQSFSRSHAPTVRAIRRLASLGFLEVSEETNQARFTGKVFVDRPGMAAHPVTLSHTFWDSCSTEPA